MAKLPRKLNLESLYRAAREAAQDLSTNKGVAEAANIKQSALLGALKPNIAPEAGMATAPISVPPPPPLGAPMFHFPQPMERGIGMRPAYTMNLSAGMEGATPMPKVPKFWEAAPTPDIVESAMKNAADDPSTPTNLLQYINKARGMPKRFDFGMTRTDIDPSTGMPYPKGATGEGYHMTFKNLPEALNAVIDAMNAPKLNKELTTVPIRLGSGGDKVVTGTSRALLKGVEGNVAKDVWMGQVVRRNIFDDDAMRLLKSFVKGTENKVVSTKFDASKGYDVPVYGPRYAVYAGVKPSEFMATLWQAQAVWNAVVKGTKKTGNLKTKLLPLVTPENLRDTGTSGVEALLVKDSALRGRFYKDWLDYKLKPDAWHKSKRTNADKVKLYEALDTWADVFKFDREAMQRKIEKAALPKFPPKGRRSIIDADPDAFKKADLTQKTLLRNELKTQAENKALAAYQLTEKVINAMQKEIGLKKAIEQIIETRDLKPTANLTTNPAELNPTDRYYKFIGSTKDVKPRLLQWPEDKRIMKAFYDKQEYKKKQKALNEMYARAMRGLPGLPEVELSPEQIRAMAKLETRGKMKETGKMAALSERKKRALQITTASVLGALAASFGKER